MPVAVINLNIFSVAQTVSDAQEPIRIEANAAKDFAYPYYLFVPSELRDAKARKQTHTIVVIPNNTGKLDDALEVHEADVKKRIKQNSTIAGLLKIGDLDACFSAPRHRLENLHARARP